MIPCSCPCSLAAVRRTAIRHLNQRMSLSSPAFKLIRNPRPLSFTRRASWLGDGVSTGNQPCSSPRDGDGRSTEYHHRCSLFSDPIIGLQTCPQGAICVATIIPSLLLALLDSRLGSVGGFWQFGAHHERHPSTGVSPLDSQLAQPGQRSTSKRARLKLRRVRILQDRPHIQTPE